MSELQTMTFEEQRLIVLASEINIIKEQTRSTVLTAACEIGKRLIEAKNNLPHGRFGTWLEENVDCSERQAQQLMALYEEYGRNPDARALNVLSVSQAVALLSAPDEVREELIESGAAAEMSVRELKEEIARQKAEIVNRQTRIEELEAAASAADVRVKQAEKDAEEAQRQRKQAESERNTAISRQGIAERERDEIRKELEQERQAEPVITEVEVVPQEIAEELDRLRDRARKAPNKEVIIAREAYEQGIAQFRKVRDNLELMADAERVSYSKAFADGIQKMADLIRKVETP